MMRTQIGKYPLTEIEDPLYGGMGTVYKAKHPDLDVPVAIKEPYLKDPEYVSEFQREAKRTAELRHPHIVEIHDAELESGTPYLVMEFLPDSLKHLLERENRLPWKQAIEIGIQICKALAYAHTRKPEIVHRDIKPANILLTDDGSIKVCDFGLAIALQASTSFKRFGLAGTPEYMPPEQWRPQGNEDIDARADIYALGITLFQMVQGALPYQDRNPFSLWERHRSEPLPEFTNDLDLPVALREIILKATAKSPDDRYQTADEMREALEAWSDDLVRRITLSPIEQEERNRAFEEAERALTDAIRAFESLREQYGSDEMDESEDGYSPLLTRNPDTRPYRLLDAGFPGSKLVQDNDTETTGGKTWESAPEFLETGFLDVTQLIRDDPENGDMTSILAQLDTADLQSALADLTDEIRRNPNNLYLRQLRGLLYGQNEMYGSAIDDLTFVLDTTPNDVGALNNRGRAHHFLKDYQASINDFNIALTIAPNSALIHRNRADAYDEVKEYDLAISDLTEAIHLEPTGYRSFNIRGIVLLNKDEYQNALKDFSEAIRLNPGFFRAYRNRATAFRALDENQKAIDDYTELIRFAPDSYDAYSWRGDLYRDLEEYDKAITDYTTAIKLNPSNSHGYNKRGLAYRRLKQYKKAINEYTEAIRLNPKWPGAYTNRGTAYHDLEEYNKAIADYTKAIELDPNNAIRYRHRGNAYRFVEEYQKAVDDLTEAIRLDPQYAITFLNRGICHRYLEEYQIAVNDLTTCISIDPEYARAYLNRGIAYRYLEEYQKAIDDLTTAINLDPEYARAYRTRGDAYWRLNNYENAIDDYTRSITIEPQNSLAYFARGWNQADLGQHQLAIDDYTKALEIDSESGSVDAEKYKKRAESYFVLRQYQLSVNDYDEAIALSFEPVDEYRRRAAAYLELGHIRQAIQDLEVFERLHPDMSMLTSLADVNPPEPTIPRSIGPYEISELLSASGLSLVYKGYHPEFGRHAAIRVSPDWAKPDSKLAINYETEAKLLARMQHPNIVTLYEYQTKGGEYQKSDDASEYTWSPHKFEYTVMEFIPSSLRDKLDEGGLLPIDEAIQIAIEACRGLEYIHTSGLVHCDIRPAHILIGANTEVKLSSFFLTKKLSTQKEESSQVSLHNLGVADSDDYTVSGSPAYMPPELWRGEPVDGRLDIYSLGATLFETITGNPPFIGENMEIFLQHQNDPIPPISSDLNVPAGLENIIQKAMGKAPEDRFPSATDLRVALESIR